MIGDAVPREEARAVQGMRLDEIADGNRKR
jgi:hypothetical protein